MLGRIIMRVFVPSYLVSLVIDTLCTSLASVPEKGLAHTLKMELDANVRFL